MTNRIRHAGPAMAVVVAAAVTLTGACGGGSSTKAADAGTGRDGPSGTEGSSGAGTGAGSGTGTGKGSATGSGSGTGTSSGTGATDAGKTTCLGSTFLTALGTNRLVVGVSGSDGAAGAAPYDLRYTYISGGVSPGATPCTACGSSCSTSWWGCYNSPPGAYATLFESTTANASPAQVPMFTYYEILQTAQATLNGFQEGTTEVTQAATNSSLMARYYNDWRFFLQQVGSTRAILHVEPDFWGYVRQAGDPATLPAAVGAANATDCASLPATIGGMGQCMIAMARKYAPNALVGLQASAWNSIGNTDPSTDVTVDAKAVASVLAACGQSKADFVVVETSDRDAGYYQLQGRNAWWDPTDKALPDYAQDLTWIKALTEALGVPALYWQTPLGNSAQSNVANHYKDNRVDYFFGGSASQVMSGAAVTVPAHWSELAAAHVVGVAFGSGATGQTDPDTDGGNLATKTKAYVAAGGQTLCP